MFEGLYDQPLENAMGGTADDILAGIERFCLQNSNSGH